ncbi:hypothetical protein O181_023403 [Austropuccinia psidii MF-1]|uniref:Uncharacterized protein n=1 Tax=Austropuccinia psidii MF-1 TaxID=1389203 RepID=A0A9Q3CIQ6_9BASI|nr:hypothetical protein [Austropuccinia psidii MF-1]
MSPVHLRSLGIPRNHLEDRGGLPRTRRPGRGHLGHSDRWQEIERNHTHSAIHIPIQQKPQTRGLEEYGSSSSAPPTPQRPFSMKHGQQEVQPILPLGRTWSNFPEGHVLDTPYHQEDIKPDALLENKERSPSQYQDGYNMSYPEKEELKQLPEASRWPKSSGTGEYDHMELIDYIDVPIIPDYWITA